MNSAKVDHINDAGDDSMTNLSASSRSEERQLAELGYRQELKREFSWLSTFSFALSISGLLSTVTSTYGYPLTAGGAPAVVWCWFIGGAGAMTIAFSVAELVSAYPTSGGLYYTIKKLAPPRYVPIVSWTVGWLNLLGQIAGVSSTVFTLSKMTLAAASIATGSAYVPTEYTTVGVFAAFMAFHTILNSLNTKWLSEITRYYAIINILSTVAVIISLIVMQPNKNSASFVLTEVVSFSGWSSKGFSFLFGFLSVSWVMTDYDATAHIAEEIKNPSIKAPIAIIAALGTTYILGLVLSIVLAICMGSDYSRLLNSPTGLPAAQIFFDVIGRAGGIAFMALCIVIGNFTAATALQAQARTLYALARDEMVPFSNIWMKVNPYSGTPLYAVWISGLLCGLLGLIDLASPTAIVAIFSATAIALDWSYCIPFICKVIWPKMFKPGPVSFGRFSFVINIYAIIWTIFLSIVFLFPTALPVTAVNMNYALVVLMGVIFFAVAFWYTGARKYYIGPRSYINDEQDYNMNERVISKNGSKNSI